MNRSLIVLGTSSLQRSHFQATGKLQANNKPFFGWVLVAKDDLGGALKKPLDYTLVWSSESLKIKQHGNGYIWLPTPPDGYKAIGHLTWPSLVCVRSDLTDQCEAHKWTWGPETIGKEESKPVAIEPTGSNLPQGGSNDGAYWLDLPIDEGAKERVMKGDLGNSQAKVKLVNVPLGKIGEHVGDWEHVTLRVSNFNGELQRVYFSEHSGGTWVDASELEFQNGNKVVAYASLHGHAFYSKPGLVLQGSGGIGISNDTEKSKLVMDTGVNYSLVSAEYLHEDCMPKEGLHSDPPMS
uniref:Neprosin domain-containing protein n=1 Tax=Fagus sylvatica TaxID=28930 RepID=A0A2N9FZY8_FAGSY